MKRWPSRAHQQRRFFVRGNCSGTGQFLEQAEQFEHDYDDDNYSDYVEDVSVHAQD
jgi:hypothetical protein